MPTEKIIEFPDAKNESGFKSALDRLPMKVKKLHRSEDFYTLELRPEDINQFREKLKSKGLADCPATNEIFNRLCLGENIQLRTWL